MLTQSPDVAPQFDVSYILGGYRSVIISGGSGYAVSNTITIPGTSLGGQTTANDLQLTVTSVNSTGAVLSGITSGTPTGNVNKYYLQVISETQVGVYSNPNLTVAVSGQNFPYSGITSTTATETVASTDIITVTSSAAFDINSPIVFTGTVFGNIILGNTYYITGFGATINAGSFVNGTQYRINSLGDTNWNTAAGTSGITYAAGDIFTATVVGSGTGNVTSLTQITIAETIGGSTFQLVNATGSMTMAKSGDYVFLSEPFYFNPSIVKYNNRLYQCIISNNDPYFIFGKWELLTSGDRRLNALDRIVGYYKPDKTNIEAWNQYINMPGDDLTQLVSGITYPNSTYMGNAFAPADQYVLDTVLQDTPFYPTGVDLKAIVWNGLVYIAGSDSSTYSAFNVSSDATGWTINKLSNQSLGITDLIYAGGSYVITTDNAATPILVSDNGYTWISNGTFTPFDGIPWDMGNFDVSSVIVPSLSLNGVTYQSGVYVAVGSNIVTSTDLYTWTERYAFTNGLTNVFNGVCYASTAGYTGFVAIGLGQQAINGNPVNYAIIYRSLDAYTWSQVSFTATQLGFNSIASNRNAIVAVGDGGIIYSSFNASSWFPQSSPTSNKLINIIWDSYNDQFIAVGENGRLLTGTSDGSIWTIQTTGVSSTLENVVWNNQAKQYVAVGLNNTIIISDDAITWTISSTFETAPSTYTVQGDDFTAGYGPEELVPGVVADTIMMTVVTRPGTNWDETVYQHVGYNVVSTEIAPTSNSQLNYSFVNVVTTPAQLAVFVIDYITGLCTSLYEGNDYSIDWVNKIVTLETSITYVAPGTTDKLRIDVYEVGNGDQLVKANTETDPIRVNSVTGFDEIYVNANYSASIYQGSGIVRPDTQPVVSVAIQTDSISNSITCTDIDSFILNSAIKFSGEVFGGIVEDTVYYVKTIGQVSRRITISETYNLTTGTAGETFILTSGTGSMEVVISVGLGVPYTPPAVYHNGSLMVLGTSALIIKTKAINNAITTISTDGLIVNSPIVFSNTIFGGVIVPQQIYYVKQIIDGNEFTISNTVNGNAVVLTNATGGSTFVTNDFAIGLSDNGITAAIIFAGKYDAKEDYITYSLFGETLPIQYGYTIPQVELFTGTGSTSTFNLNNFVGGNNPTNAIVEVNGVRQTESAYSISSLTNSIIFYTPPSNNSTVAVTTYNQTDRQYFSSQYGITGSTGSSLLSITVSNTTHFVVPFDYAILAGNFVVGECYTIQTLNNGIGGANTNFTLIGALSNTVGVTFTATGVGSGTGSAIIAGDGFDATIQTVGSFVVGQPYTIVTLGTTTNTQWNTIAGTSAVTYSVGSTFNCVNIGTGYGTGTAYTVGLFDGELNYLTLASGSTGDLTLNSPIIFSNTIGGIVSGQIYYITGILSGTDFTVSTTVGGLPTVVSTASGTMTGVINGTTVANITNISNSIVPSVIIAISGTQSSGNLVICDNTLNMSVGQTIVIQSPIFTAGSFVNTTTYQIVTLGSTNWNAIGYVGDPEVGGLFICNAVAQTGTGTALIANVGGIDTTGQVYFVRSIPDSTHFTIEDQYNTLITLTNATETLKGYVGGSPTARITTGIPHNLTLNQIVRIDGVLGSVQLNNNTYYVHVINNTQIDIYTQPYNPALYAVNYPVDYLGSYISGGYVWLDQLFTIIDTTATSTTANGNRITVLDTTIIVPNSPILFTKVGTNTGDDILGGILAKTQYYVYKARPEVEAGNFIVGNEYEILILGSTNWGAIGGSASPYVGETFIATGIGSGTGYAFGLQEFTITENRYPNQAEVLLTDATGSINVTEFEQDNVDRLWVTINGYRVPSSALRMNPYNNLSILSTVVTGDQIIITSMMPSATPNEETYLLNVTMKNEPTVFRANIQTRTWLTKALAYSDEIIYLNDITRVTDSVVQNVTCPSEVDGKYNIGLTSDKNTICHLTVYNNTTGVTVDPANYKIILESIDTQDPTQVVVGAPVVQIFGQVSVGNELTITSIVGRLAYINGEQIGFRECNLEENTISLLVRGANGTGVQNYSPEYTEVYGLIPSNAMSDVLYSDTWNPIPGLYNPEEGDPLQIADTSGANFLRTDRN